MHPGSRVRLTILHAHPYPSTLLLHAQAVGQPFLGRYCVIGVYWRHGGASDPGAGTPSGVPGDVDNTKGGDATRHGKGQVDRNKNMQSQGRAAAHALWTSMTVLSSCARIFMCGGQRFNRHCDQKRACKAATAAFAPSTNPVLGSDKARGKCSSPKPTHL